MFLLGKIALYFLGWWTIRTYSQLAYLKLTQLMHMQYHYHEHEQGTAHWEPIVPLPLRVQMLVLVLCLLKFYLVFWINKTMFWLCFTWGQYDAAAFRCCTQYNIFSIFLTHIILCNIIIYNSASSSSCQYRSCFGHKNNKLNNNTNSN